MEGTFTVTRAIWQHPLFDGVAMSKREAFLWMVSEAAFKRHERQVRGQIVTVERGQFTHSIRYMAERFRWKRGVVERFCNRLKTETMIETQSAAGQLLVTICNYDRYQPPLKSAATPTGTANGKTTGQQRDSSGTNKNKGNKGNKAAAAGEHDQLEAMLRSAAGDAVDPSSPNLCVLSAPLGWIQSGAELSKDILPAVKAVCARPRQSKIRDWGYFTQAVLEAQEQRRQGGRGMAPVVNSGVTMTPQEFSEKAWRMHCKWYREFVDANGNPDYKRWHASYGPKPGEPGCLAPAAILAEFGFKERTEQ